MTMTIETLPPQHTHLSGPVCSYWYSTGHRHHEDPGTCIHSSCELIVYGSCVACDVDNGMPLELALAAAAETAWTQEQMARGELAFAPETMPCYECGHADPDQAIPGDLGFPYVDRKVTALGPVTNRADPTQTYRLSCGHLAF